MWCNLYNVRSIEPITELQKNLLQATSSYLNPIWALKVSNLEPDSTRTIRASVLAIPSCGNIKKLHKDTVSTSTFMSSSKPSSHDWSSNSEVRFGLSKPQTEHAHQAKLPSETEQSMSICWPQPHKISRPKHFNVSKIMTTKKGSSELHRDSKAHPTNSSTLVNRASWIREVVEDQTVLEPNPQVTCSSRR